MPISNIEEVLGDLKQGKMIILVDDERRENEGDLTIAAEKVTPAAINFMAKYGRGLICLALEPEIVERLRLDQMVRDNRSPYLSRQRAEFQQAYLRLTGHIPS